jgi:hypothetical protein
MLVEETQAFRVLREAAATERQALGQQIAEFKSTLTAPSSVSLIVSAIRTTRP